MVTLKDVLRLLDITVSVLTDIRQIVVIVPDLETLQHCLRKFKDFLYKDFESQ